MNKVKFLIAILLLPCYCFAQYPNPLPSNGDISIQQIASWMLSANEIRSTSNVSLSTLNAASHLNNHTAPFSIADWYGYKVGSLPAGNIQISVNFINGYHNFFGNHNSGYQADAGYIQIKDNTTNLFCIIRYNGDGGPQTLKRDPYTLDSSYFTMVKDNGTVELRFLDDNIDSGPDLYEFGPFESNPGDLGLFKTLIRGGTLSFTINKSDLYAGIDAGKDYANPNYLQVKIQKK